MTDRPDLNHPQVQDDPRAAYDEARAKCPVAHHTDTWVALGHAEVVRVATDPRTYSSAHPTRRAIPNSLDGIEHAAYRAVVDRFMTPARVAAEEPRSRAIAAALVEGLPRRTSVGAVASIGTPFAVKAQCAWLGWPSSMERELVAWMADNHAATRSGNRGWTAQVAERFDEMIVALLDARQGRPAEDVTGEVMHATVADRPLTNDEVVSILRNWTAGDLGSLAASIGVIAHLLATRPGVQHQMRERVAAGDTAWIENAIEEILRIDDPFVSNRRTATVDTVLGGQSIGSGERVLINWTAANRDPAAFSDPDAFEPEANAGSNLVFGIGPHVCPGRGLTLMELRVLVEELLRATTWVSLADEPVRETPPLGGWAEVPLILT